VQTERVYILGAGCSAAHYPLANGFLAALKEFQAHLQERPNCARLRAAVGTTITLLEKYQTPTIDRLAVRLDEELAAQKQQVHWSEGLHSAQLEKEADENILAAKIATVALFLEREEAAKRTGLTAYQDFLNLMFENNRSPEALRSSPVRVLTFNYDRLFETAFIEYFRLGSTVDCYGPDWLNSGLDFLTKHATATAPDRFSFLKLHGTIATWVGQDYGEPRYAHTGVGGITPLIDDALLWPQGRTSSPSATRSPEPLIVFPHEKQRARQRTTSFPFDTYIQGIWDQAIETMKKAGEIWIIGYSFAPADRTSIVELLDKSPSHRIIIQNPSAESICEDLRLRHPSIGSRLTALPKPF
jgi:hypothetical protein